MVFILNDWYKKKKKPTLRTTTTQEKTVFEWKDLGRTGLPPSPPPKNKMACGLLYGKRWWYGRFSPLFANPVAVSPRTTKSFGCGKRGSSTR